MEVWLDLIVTVTLLDLVRREARVEHFWTAFTLSGLAGCAAAATLINLALP